MSRNLVRGMLAAAVILVMLGCETTRQPEEVVPAESVVVVPDPIPASPELVVINEAASIGDYEFIELFSLSEAPLVFSDGWVLSDDGKGYEDGDIPFVIPEGTEMAPYGYLLICPFSAEDAKSVLNDKDLPADALCDISFSLGDSDSVTLYYGTMVVDSLSWTSDVNSAGRVEDGFPELSTMLRPTPGRANRPEGIDDDTGILINEICSKGDDYVELINAGTKAFTFQPNSWYLEDARKKRDIMIAGGLRLKPGEVHLIYTGQAADPLKLGSADTVILRHGDDMVDWYAWSEHVESIGRDPDDVGTWTVMAKTPGETNTTAATETE